MKERKRYSDDLFTRLVKTQFKVDCVREHRFCERMWRFDYAIPSLKIAIEVEGGVWTGGRHTRPQGFIGDMEKYNRATAMGWKVLRFMPERLLAASTLDLIKMSIQERCGNTKQ